MRMARSIAELISRLTKYTGSVAAAMALVESTGLAQALAGCLSDVRVAENDPAVVSQNLTIHGEGGPLFIYQSLPRDYSSTQRPAVLVIHENRGLNKHKICEPASCKGRVRRGRGGPSLAPGGADSSRTRLTPLPRITEPQSEGEKAGACYRRY